MIHQRQKSLYNTHWANRVDIVQALIFVVILGFADFSLFGLGVNPCIVNQHVNMVDP